MDHLSREKRSWNMSRIKNRNTKPEMILRKLLYARGIRYRLHKRDLPGRPDLVLSKFKAVIFVHGCFWHLHEGCKNSKIPATNFEFWRNKLEGNQERDTTHQIALLELGWRVLTVWECSLHACRHDLDAFIERIVGWLEGSCRLGETTEAGELITIKHCKHLHTIDFPYSQLSPSRTSDEPEYIETAMVAEPQPSFDIS